MADADREKWDARYRDGAYESRTHPNAWLAECLDRVPVGSALDVACGAGRNALFLAAAGFTVDAIDISSVALARARQTAAARGLAVNWIEHDLDQPLPLTMKYDLITVLRYVNLPLLTALTGRLADGGCLVVEEHLTTTEAVAGPRNPAFRVDAGELAKVAHGLEILHLEEGIVSDPDGARVAVARLLARH